MTAPNANISFAALSADHDNAIAAHRHLRVAAFNAYSASGGSARILSGTDASGPTGTIGVVALNAGGAQFSSFGEAGVMATAGLSIAVMAGTVDLNIAYRRTLS